MTRPAKINPDRLRAAAERQQRLAEYYAAKAELAAAWAEIERMTGELASANRECEVRNERELGYLARAQSAEAELEALRADGKETVALDARQFQQRARAQEITDEQ